jgi:cation diffusion facilitator family transporter
MSSSQNIRLQRWVVLTGIVLLGGKFAAFLLTGSNAILTDALESIVNVVAGSFALYSLVLAAKPQDEDHPYGHGKIEFISASVEGAMIVIAGALIAGKSIYDFFHPHPLQKLDLGIVLIVISGIVNFIVGFSIARRGKKTHSMTMVAGGKHLQSDAWSTVGIVAGLVLIRFTGWTWIDNATALIFGGIIMYSGYRIVRKSISGIMDEADMELLGQIIEVLNENRHPNWIDIHNMRVIRYGPSLHIDCHVTVPYYLDVRQAHSEIEMIDQLINSRFENRVEFFIHTDGCVETSCSICSVANCPVRKFPKEATIHWTPENVLKNQKHRLV